MVIGFLGKGGSGKSTTSTKFISYLVGKNKKVLAIDADHNMDLTYNLLSSDPVFYGSSLSELKRHVGVQENTSYQDIVLQENPPTFSFDPLDDFSQTIINRVSNSVSLMSAGPHTDAVLHGQSCSHSLFTLLKVYLPLLKLSSDQIVVVDEKAGTDGAGTGVPTGFTGAVIMVEPTVYGVKAANQIARVVDFFGVPYEFALNKVRPADDVSAAVAGLIKAPAFKFLMSDYSVGTHDISDEDRAEFDRVYEWARNLPDVRMQRSRAKFIENKEFVSAS